MVRTAFLVCLSAAAIAMIRSASAQDTGTISAERPGFSSSPIALDASVLQVEAGYQYTRNRGGVDFDDSTLPLALLRIGLLDRLELQLGWSGFSRLDVDSSHVDGITDVTVGVKWQLNPSDALVPVALFGGVSLPVGDDAFSSDEVDPIVGAFWSYTAGLDWFGTVLLREFDNTLTISPAVGTSFPVAVATSAYVEYFGNYVEGNGPAHYLNGGFAYLPRNDMQLDLNVGVGLNGRAADFFFGFGLAYRF
jgi:hypothetical protein